MKRLLPLLSLFYSVFLPRANSQSFGNEWINYSQKYLEIKITDTGIYRINYSALSQGLSLMGESLSSVDPRRINIYGRGEEQYIYLEGENDSSFDANDFIEFYACGSDGWLDASLYVSSSDQSNPYYSIFNDTATYYLTISGTNGKRLGIINYSSSTTTPAAFFYKEEVVSFATYFYQGEYFGSASGPAHPFYRAGKGWFSASINNEQTLSAILNTPFAQTNNIQDASVEIVLAGANSNQHKLLVSFGAKDTTVIFTGYQLMKFNLSLPCSTLAGSTGFSVKSLTGASQQPDRTALSHFYIKYPRIFNFSNVSNIMMILPSSADTSLISASSYAYNDSYIYDLTSKKRIQTNYSSGNLLKAKIPPNPSERKCYLFSESQIKNISTLTPLSPSGKFTDFYAEKDMDSAFVIITHPSLMTAGANYKNYREAILANIDELYDQFSYGINKHPLAIKNFCRFLIANFSTPPQHLFLIGKAISDDVHSTRNNVSLYEQNLVPTFGWPSSDVAFTSGLNGNAEPAIPTGRLAAKTNAEVQAYLDKVILYETKLIETEVTQTSIPNKIWMKHAIHFCGGDTESLNSQLCGFLDGHKAILEKDLYGGKVTTVSKNSTDPIEVNLTDSIKDMIEEGVSILNFFGHSSANYTDMSIGYPDEYLFLKKRYPFMIVNGCFSGDIFTTTSTSTSELFILSAEKGAIGYLAHTGQGFPNDLNIYTSGFYEQLSKKSYGKTVGQCIKQSIAEQQPTGFIPFVTAMGMTLHGDPAIKINTHEKPDYAIAPEYVFFNPKEVTTADENFEMNIVVFNLGMARTDSVPIFIRRTLPNGTKAEYTRMLPPVFYNETLKISLPVDIVNGAGLNQFYIHVDPNLSFDEIAEMNNYIGNNKITLMIRSGELVPVYPYNYAVVPNRNLVLKASTSDPFASSKNYVFQIDTTDTYNSPEFREFKITAPGGVVKWNIDSAYFDLPDSIAYFWRTSPDNPGNYRWREHSFQIIQGKSGWGQKHFYQYKNDDTTEIYYNRPERKFEFRIQQKGLRCEVIGNPSGDQYNLIQYLIDNAQQDYNSATLDWPAMYIAIIDKCSLEPWGTRRLINEIWYNPENNFGNCNDQYSPYGRKWIVENYFVFLINDPVQMDSLRNLLNNKIPEGSFVLAYSFGTGMFTNNSAIWDSTHIDAFKNLGAQGINDVVDPFPYIFFGQKGNPAFGKEEFGLFANDTIILSANMTGCKDEAFLSTPVIGPSQSWSSLHWNFKDAVVPEDSVEVYVLNGISDAMVKSYSGFSDDIIPLSADVSAVSNPYIRLKARIKDDTAATPAQLAGWYVLFDEIPEAALNASHTFSFHDSIIQQGDKLTFSIAIENVSKTDMDSLRIKYIVENAQQISDSTIIKKNKPFPAGSVMVDTISFPTKNLSANCRFWIEVNPRDSLWQLEQYHFNNIASLGFSVDRDNMNPLLDVTFDGVRILNGDIVSPKPEIIIQLKDENKYLALDDTAKFRIFIKDPEDKSERIYFSKDGQEQMRFNKAVLPDNKCKIEYHPVFSKDGIYELSVQGSDASGNDAGDLDYSISFEVINKSSITEVLNYPNPFSTSTRFVFTLTGSVVPDYFKIQVLTVSGKVIREITRAELGTIHIGRNITDFAWNGTDEFGDPLANGVYLYRVIVKINGEAVEHRASSADPFFKKSFGKMYLMR